MSNIFKQVLSAALSRKDTGYESSVPTTLCENKKSLSQRFAAVLKEGRRSKRAVALSVVAAMVLCSAAVCLGAPLSDGVLYPLEGGPQDADSPTVIRSNVGPLPYGEDERQQDGQDVQALAEAFGKTMKMVALVAPADVVAESIGENYAEYVTPELLARWQKDPQNAPGRVGSSPWPERIDVLSVECGSATEYTVYGEVIEVTSVELVKGEAAAKRPVTLEVRKVDGRWLISDVTFGGRVQRGPVVYENTRYGFRFYLPESWKGYTIVEEQWQSAVAGEVGTEPAQTGPQLLIRHPAWTEQDPRQDIPIMVFTLEQWSALQKGEFFVGAAPIGPRKLGGNSEYVFAIPARYNFAFPTGYEEVEEILNGSPLWPTEDIRPALMQQDYRWFWYRANPALIMLIWK